MIVCAALMRGVCYADPPASASVDNGKHQVEGKPSDGKQDDRRASGEKGPGDQVDATKANIQQPSNQPGRSDETANNNLPKGPLANATNLHPLVKPANLAGGGLSKMDDKRPLPARSTALVPLGGPSLNNMRNHSSGLAVVGGAANPIRNAAAINGTGMNRKP